MCLSRWRLLLLVPLGMEWFLLPLRIGWLAGRQAYWDSTPLVFAVALGDTLLFADIVVRQTVSRKRESVSTEHDAEQSVVEVGIDVAACLMLYLTLFIQNNAVYFVCLVPRLRRCGRLVRRTLASCYPF